MAQTPEDIEFLIRYHFNRYRGLIVLGVLLVAVILVAGTIFYQVEADSEGVVLRLGRYVRTTPPGLHTKLPWPIETVDTVPVQRIESLEFGFATAQPGRRTQYARATAYQAEVARMLTGDLNLAHVEWIVQYRIKDAFSYLFKIGGSADSRVAVGDLIRDVSEAVMRKLVGDASIDEVITIGRDKIASDAKIEIQKMLDSYEAGIDIVTVKLQTAAPPAPVRDAFDAVNRARQNKERVVNEALGERNRKIPAARGQRDRMISEAEGYKERVVREMTGRANAFLSQLAEFEKAPEVTKVRLYLETMEEVLGRVGKLTVIDTKVQGVLPLLNLDGQSLPGVRGQGGAR